MKFVFLTDVMLTVLWDLIPCSSVDKYQRCRWTLSSIIGVQMSSALNMETAVSFETFAPVYQNTLRYISEGGSLQSNIYIHNTSDVYMTL